jgi:alanyl-tRNA synthetase
MSTIAERVTIEDALLQALHADGYLELKPEGLITPLFPDTFAASAFHTQIVDAMTRQVNIGRRAGVEWVFRHVDADKVGNSAAHLSLFRMLVYFSTVATDARKPKHDAVQRFLSLTESAGLRRDRITVTYFGGGTIGDRDVPPDSSFAEAWTDAGILSSRVIPVGGPANFTNIRRAGEPAGPRCEVYYDVATFPFRVEIGTVVCEQYLLGADGRPEAVALSVCGGAFGVERLEMCTRGLAMIGDTLAVKDLVHQLLDGVPEPSHPLFRPQAVRIANGLRALTTAAAYVGAMGSDRRSGRLRTLSRDVIRAAREIGIVLTDALVRGLCASVDLHEAAGAPHARDVAEIVARWIAQAAAPARNSESV